MSYTYEFEFDYNDIILSVEVDITSHCDANYGADADGRRGEHRDFPEVDEIRVFDEKGNQVTDLEVLKAVEEDFDHRHLGKAFDQAVKVHHEPPEREYDEFD